jgi:hypothetical protein
MTEEVRRYGVIAARVGGNGNGTGDTTPGGGDDISRRSLNITIGHPR